MKKFLYLLFILIMALGLVLTGCAGEAEEPGDEPADVNGEEPADDGEPLRVGMVLPGPIDDGGWNTSGYQGLVALEEELGAEIAFNEQTSVSDYGEVLRNYAVQGFDIVIGHSAAFTDPVKEMAPEFPDTHFVVTSTNISQEPNVSSLANDNGEQGFILGAIAAIITETDHVAGIGSLEIVSIIDSMIGFEAGARYINPDIRVDTTFTGDHDDAAGAKELGLSFINEGADVLFPNANRASLGVIEAAEEEDIYILGSIGDMAEVSPETVVTSGRFDFPLMFVTFVEQYLEDDFEAGSYTFGMAEGVLYLAPFRDFEESLPEEQIEQIRELEQALISGELNYRDYADVNI